MSVSATERSTSLDLALPDELPSGLTGPWKRGLDLLIAIPLLVFTAPLLAAIAVLIRSQGRGPVFYHHRRCGLNGSHFTLLKFRTMAPGADGQLEAILNHDPEARHDWETYRKLRHDPRVTPLGQFLRRSSIDELPQLLNIIAGQMSLVGPRPVVDEELERFGSHASLYSATRPGLTGLWQISGRNETDFDTRIQLDTAYVRGWSLARDIRILAMTIPVVLFAKGAR